MTRIKRIAPPPVILVAVVALMAALAGSSVAEVATTAKLSKGERKQVGKIAKKTANTQIKKKAPGLSVASAENSGNADKLDGRDASELRTSSAAVERTANMALTSDVEDVLTTTITTTGTRVIALGVVEAAHGEDITRFLRCQIRIAGVDGIVYGSDVQVREGGNNGEITMSPMSALEVGPGTHPVALRCAGTDLTVDEAALSAWAVGS